MNDEQHTQRSTVSGADAPMVLGGRYRTQRPLARGGMATVYLGQDTLLNRAVAIKVMAGDIDQREQNAFLREARAVAQLAHPNIVDVYDVGLEGSIRYIVMEYVPGDTLRDVIAREERLDPTWAVELTARLADALAYSHGRGVIHCDMKPGNVLLGDHGEAKIVDFGVARNTATAGEFAQTVAGTAGYIAPEQIEGRPLDGRADVYSLAAMLYEMLAGRPPHSGSLTAIAAQRLNAPAPPLSRFNNTVPPAIEAVVMRGLEREPEQRQRNAAQFAAELRAAISGRQPTAAGRTGGYTEQATVVARAPGRRGQAGPATEVATPVRGATSEQRNKPWLFIMLAGLLTAVLAGLLVLLAITAFDLGGGGNVAVPTVTGVLLDDAAREIRGAGLRVGDVRFVQNSAPFGTVIAQEPADGVLDSGESIALTVSLGAGQ